MKAGITFLSKKISQPVHAITKPVLFSCLILSSLLSGNAFALYWEISDLALPYIARVRADPNWGAAVIYNPKTCKEIGAACGFFKKHAYAHAMRNHLLLPPESYPPAKEDEADCWAAKYSEPSEVRAAVALFLDEKRDPGLKITGNAAMRAEKVRACAEKADNWDED